MRAGQGGDQEGGSDVTAVGHTAGTGRHDGASVGCGVGGMTDEDAAGTATGSVEGTADTERTDEAPDLQTE